MAEETENQEQHEPDAHDVIQVAPEPTRWQIRFKSGQGQQVTALSAEEAHAWAVSHYGEEYEIASVEPIV